jgi:4-amino-4-deoxy-L-arabinose transferase-like glycosyltransferase
MGLAQQVKLTKVQLCSILVIFLVALLMRLSYGLSAEHDVPLRADAYKYAMIGINLAESGTYSYDESGATSKLITPGYPMIVAFFVSLFDDFSSAYIAILAFQILLSSFVAVLTYLISIRFLNNLAAVIVAGAVAISPHLIISSSYFLTETTHSFSLILSIYLLLLAVEKRVLGIAILAGLAFGYSALIRPAVLLFPIPLVAIIWWKYHSGINLRVALCFIVATFLVWTPWQLWEADTEESNVRQVLALGAYPNMIHESPELRGFPYQEDPEFELMQADWANVRSVLSQRFSQRPLTYLEWYLVGKPIMLWSAWAIQGQGGPYIYPIISSIYSENRVYSFSLLLMMKVHTIIFLIAFIAIVSGLLRLFLMNKDVHFIITTLTLFVLYHTAVHMVLAPLPRFSFPYYPILFMLAGYGSLIIWNEINRRRNNG